MSGLAADAGHGTAELTIVSRMKIMGSGLGINGLTKTLDESLLNATSAVCPLRSTSLRLISRSEKRQLRRRP